MSTLNTAGIERLARLSDPLVKFTQRRAETDQQDRTVFAFASLVDAWALYDSAIGNIPAVGYPYVQPDGTVHVVTRTYT